MQGDTLTITGSEVNHIRNVLRMKTGDEISVSNGQDEREYRYGIERMEEDAVYLRLRFIKEDKVELPVKVYLFQGLPKSDKMDLIVQKAVELGVYAVIPVRTDRSVLKLDEGKAAKKTARWQSIAEAAAMQSRRKVSPRVFEPMSMKEAVRFAVENTDRRCIPYELQEDPSGTGKLLESLREGESLSVFIGPEGGFEPKEIALAQENGIEPISLGRRILRTETAGMAFLAWLVYILEIR